MKSTLIFIFLAFRMPATRKTGMDAMLVCHCRGVSDRQIKRAVKNGAASLREVARATGAGMRCGGCRENVAKVVEDAIQCEFRPSSVSSMIRLELPLSAKS